MVLFYCECVVLPRWVNVCCMIITMWFASGVETKVIYFGASPTGWACGCSVHWRKAWRVKSGSDTVEFTYKLKKKKKNQEYFEEEIRR